MPSPRRRAVRACCAATRPWLSPSTAQSCASSRAARFGSRGCVTGCAPSASCRARRRWCGCCTCRAPAAKSGARGCAAARPRPCAAPQMQWPPARGSPRLGF
eukprot:3545971-Prymnesium_polylepis.1